MPDPLEPLNRAFFEFNDGLYFWVLKPVATGYKTVVPEEARVCVRNFFHNLAFPVRFVNNLLQGKFFGAFEETCGFLVNSTVGLGGLADIATAVDLKRHDEDLGQTSGGLWCGPCLLYPLAFFRAFDPERYVRDGRGHFFGPPHLLGRLLVRALLKGAQRGE